MNSSDTVGGQAPVRPGTQRWYWGLPLALGVWIVLYRQLASGADALVRLLGLEPESQLGDSLRFFLFDTPKVMLLLLLIVFVMGVIHTFFAPERTRALLAGRKEGVGNLFAAGLGVVTPFCSCSAVPLFLGLLSAGVPLGVIFSFLISAPMVNEVALGLLLSLFGWRIAGLYLLLGLSVAIVSGLIIGRLGMGSASGGLGDRPAWPDGGGRA
jgi:uncharacterized membrane protein YraQ (UPF0718 family)